MVLFLLRLFRSKTLYSSSLSRYRISHLSQCHTDRGRCFTAPWFSHSRIYLYRTRVYDLQFCSSCSTACRNKSGSLGIVHEPVQKLHTSARLHAIPAPLLLLVIKPLQKLTAIIIGRSIRKWWKGLPPNKKQLFREWTWRRRWHLTGAGTGLLLLITLFVLTHLEECPVTGRTRLQVLNKENFLELSKYASDECMEEFGKSFVPVSDPRQKLVEWIVNTMIQKNQDIDGMKSVPWTIHVVESPSSNAFVLPNGKIFVFTGMLEVVADIHQLSFVLGHEMSHALIGHAAEQASLSHVVDLISMIFLTMIWAICPRDSLALLGQWVQGKLVQLMFDQPFSRKLEAEADEVGLQLAAKACADVRASSVFWMQMELAEKLSGEDTSPEWLSTHPSHRNRSTHLDRLIPEALKLREKCGCPGLPATDPRSTFNKSVQLLLEKKGYKVQDGKEETQRAPVSQHQLGGVLAASALPKALLNHKDLAETTVTLK